MDTSPFYLVGMAFKVILNQSRNLPGQEISVAFTKGIISVGMPHDRAPGIG